MNTSVTKKKIQIKDVSNLDEIKRALSNTWSIIGYDVLQCCKDGGESSEMKRSEVVEVVLDANHLETNHPKLDTTVFRSLSYNQQIKVAKEVFSYSTYGM